MNAFKCQLRMIGVRIEIEEEAGGVRGGGPADVRGGRGAFLAIKG